MNSCNMVYSKHLTDEWIFIAPSHDVLGVHFLFSPYPFHLCLGCLYYDLTILFNFTGFIFIINIFHWLRIRLKYIYVLSPSLKSFLLKKVTGVHLIDRYMFLYFIFFLQLDTEMMKSQWWFILNLQKPVASIDCMLFLSLRKPRKCISSDVPEIVSYPNFEHVSEVSIVIYLRLSNL